MRVELEGSVCKCIEDGITVFITRVELLDRINLLINGAIGVREWGDIPADEKNSIGGRRIAPPSHPPRATAARLQM